MKQAAQGAKIALSDHVNLMMILKGILVSYLITVPMFIVFAVVLAYTDFPERLISPVVLITTVVSVITAGAVSTRRVRNRGWLNGSLVGFIYMLILYFLSSLIFKSFTLDTHMLLMLIAGVLSGSIGGIVGINSKKSRLYETRSARGTK